MRSNILKKIDLEESSSAVVRGMGVFCPLAMSCDELEMALNEHRDSIEPITSFDASRFLCDQASSFNNPVDVALSAGEAEWMDRATLFAVAAYREAIKQAKLDLSDIDPSRIAVCLGSSHSGLVRTEEVAKGVIDESIERLDPKLIAATLVSHCTAVIKRMSGAKGPIITVSSACASSNSAIGIAADLIRRGEADIAIAGGSDTVSLSVMSGFNALRALSLGKTAPFAQDIGLSLGEGAGIIILTRDDITTIDGCEGIAHILGYGLSGDAHHATSPDQNGIGAENAIIAAMVDAGISPDDVSYINAHGTGTEANDGAETRAIKRLFGDKVPISSTKSYYGHTLGASGVIETISSVLLAQKGRVPSNLRMKTVRKDCEHLHYANPKDCLERFPILLINNFGFGGNNSSLLLQIGKIGNKKEPQSKPDEVVITGIGIHSAAGAGYETFIEALKKNSSLAKYNEKSGTNVAKCMPLRFTTPDLQPFARTSPTTRFVLSALKQALCNDDEIYADNNRSGLICGAVFGAQKPTEKFLESVFLGNPALANAHYFPMITMNATGGAASLAFKIKGYTTTLCGSASAISYAANLALSDRQDRVAVVSGDEMTPRLERIYKQAGIVIKSDDIKIGRAQALGEFGGAMLFERKSSAKKRGAKVLGLLKGWATRQDSQDLSVSKSGDALKRAIVLALNQAGLDGEQVSFISVLDSGLAPVKTAVNNALDHVFSNNKPPCISATDVFGFAPSSGSMMTLAAALAMNKDTDVALAAGYDVIGEAFAFVIQGSSK